MASLLCSRKTMETTAWMRVAECCSELCGMPVMSCPLYMYWYSLPASNSAGCARLAVENLLFDSIEYDGLFSSSQRWLCRAGCTEAAAMATTAANKTTNCMMSASDGQGGQVCRWACSFVRKTSSVLVLHAPLYTRPTINRGAPARWRINISGTKHRSSD